MSVWMVYEVIQGFTDFVVQVIAGQMRLPDHLQSRILRFTPNMAKILGLKKYIPKIVENVRPQPQSSQRIHIPRDANVPLNPRRTEGSVLVIHATNIKPGTKCIEGFLVFPFPRIVRNWQPIIISVSLCVIIKFINCEHLDEPACRWKLLQFNHSSIPSSKSSLLNRYA